MAHKHNVVDADPLYMIDPVTRQIVPGDGSTKKHIMQFDHNSERLGFVLPRYIDGHDMSLCTKAEVHYTNTGSDGMYGISKTGVYQVDDLAISEDNENEVVCTWLISQNATSLAGELAFSLEYICETDGVLEYRLGTEEYTGLSIHPRRNNGVAVVEQFPDVLERWKAEIIEELKSTLPEEISGVPTVDESMDGFILAVTGGQWYVMPVEELYSPNLSAGGGFVVEALNEHQGILDEHSERLDNLEGNSGNWELS